MLGLQPLHPPRLIRTRQLGLGLFRQGQEVFRVRAPDLFGLPALLEFLSRVLVDGLEHHEPGLVLRPFLLPQEALVQEGGDALEGVHGQISLRVADGLAASSVRPPEKTASRAKSVFSPSSSSVWLHSMAPLRVRCLSGRSRAPPVRSFRRRPSLPSMALGGRSLTLAAASSMASGSPSRRAQISATAGAFSLVTAKSALAALALSMKSLHRLVLGEGFEAGQPLRVGDRERRHRVLVLAVDPSGMRLVASTLRRGRTATRPPAGRPPAPARSCPAPAEAVCP